MYRPPACYCKRLRTSGFIPKYNRPLPRTVLCLSECSLNRRAQTIGAVLARSKRHAIDVDSRGRFHAQHLAFLNVTSNVCVVFGALKVSVETRAVETNLGRILL